MFFYVINLQIRGCTLTADLNLYQPIFQYSVKTCLEAMYYIGQWRPKVEIQSGHPKETVTSPIMGWIGPPTKSIYLKPKPQYLRMWHYLRQPLKRWLSLNEPTRVGPTLIWLASLWEEELGHRDTPRVHAHRGMTMWGHSKRVTICKPRREDSEETRRADTLILDPCLQKCEKNQFLLFKPQVCDILLWQPLQTHPPSIRGPWRAENNSKCWRVSVWGAALDP